ncbi:hypothetical protein BJY52DRAFT_1223445 [Lactarius psammicola]|nr:hypothetical protein BJY52DRAFT_1223445 [Lactarius psammicola]
MARKRPRLAFKAARTPCDKPKPKEKPMSKPLEHRGVHSTDPSPDMPSVDIEILGPLTSNDESDHHPEDAGQEHNTGQLLIAAMSQRWHQGHGHSHPRSGPSEDSDSGEASNVPLEDELDSDDSDVIDHGMLDKECGFAIRDELGEDFESRYANIGEKLDENDRTICRAFSFKISTHMPDAAWKKACYAFQTTPPLPGLSQLRSRITFLAGFTAQIYDCCPNSCLCFAGPHSSATSCMYCGLSWYHKNGKPRKKFTYLPLVPRLWAFCANTEIATMMQYRSQCESESVPGVIKDIFDGENYKTLKSKHVQINEKTFKHHTWPVY